MTGSPRRVAAIDCGTNSVRLLIAEEDAGRLRDVSRTMRIVRLGEDVDRTGRLAATALSRTAAVLVEYRTMIRAAGIDDTASGVVRMVATSAVRDASNRDDFDAMVEQALGQRADVVSGRDEARLSFAGACAGLVGVDGRSGLDGRSEPADLLGRSGQIDKTDQSDGARRPAETGGGNQASRVLVADIGGGSTELVYGDPARAVVESATSLDVGSVRLTERHIRSDPPSDAQVAAIEADARSALDAAGRLGWTAGDRLVGVAGTVTTVAAVALGLDRYDSTRVHGVTLARAEVEQTVASLITMDRAQRQACAVIHPGRVDVIAAGAIILRAVVSHFDAGTVTVSEHDILDGIALGLLARIAPGLLDGIAPASRHDAPASRHDAPASRHDARGLQA